MFRKIRHTECLTALGISAAFGATIVACAVPVASSDEGTDVHAASQASAPLTGATSCSSFVESHLGSVNLPYSEVQYQIVGQQSSGLVSIANGNLDRVSQGFIYYNPFTHQSSRFPSTLFSSETGLQSFSNRTVWATIPGESSSRLFEFDPRAQDQIRLTLRDDGTATITLVTQGNSQINLDSTECLGNLMYGFGGNVLYTIALTDLSIPQ